MENPITTSYAAPAITHRNPISLTNLSPAKRKHLLRRLKFAFPLSSRHSADMSHPRRARIRIWRKEVVSRQRKIREISTIVQKLKEFDDRNQRLAARFALVARLHGISVSFPAPGQFPLHIHYNEIPPQTHHYYDGRLIRRPIDREVLAKSLFGHKRGKKRKRRKSNT